MTGLAAIMAAVVLAGVSFSMGKRRHRQHFEASIRHLMDSPAPQSSGSVSRVDIPEPVRRYLRLVLPEDSTPPHLVRLQQHGELRTTPTSKRWVPFRATHTASPLAPGYVWNARVDVAPLVHLRVIDSLVGGNGAGQVLLLSAIDVGHDSGTPEMNSGSLHRFLAEAVWYPWALLPSEILRWDAIDDRRATVTLTAAGTSVALEYRFATSGEVTGIYTLSRWGSFGGRYEQRTWEGHFSDYERHSGVLMPTRAEVGWFQDGSLALVWNCFVDQAALVFQ